MTYIISIYILLFLLALVLDPIIKFIVFYVFWMILIILYSFIGRGLSFSKGLASYLHYYNEDLRLSVFDEKIFVEDAIPILSPFAIIRFFLIKNQQLDKILINAKYNLLILFSSFFLIFISGVVIHLLG